jgi:hypothetical protein
MIYIVISHVVYFISNTESETSHDAFRIKKKKKKLKNNTPEWFYCLH